MKETAASKMHAHHAATPEVKNVLVLQWGGALGAYHIGAYQALHELGFEPDWVTGISIGALNAAVLATMVMDLPEKDRKRALRIGLILAYFFRGTALIFAIALLPIAQKRKNHSKNFVR